LLPAPFGIDGLNVSPVSKAIIAISQLGSTPKFVPIWRTRSPKADETLLPHASWVFAGMVTDCQYESAKIGRASCRVKDHSLWPACKPLAVQLVTLAPTAPPCSSWLPVQLSIRYPDASATSCQFSSPVVPATAVMFSHAGAVTGAAGMVTDCQYESA